MIRAEKIFQDCKDYIFANLEAQVQSLQESIGDGVVMEGFAKKSTHGLVLFNLDDYPVLVLEASGFQLDTDRTPTVVDYFADLLVQVKGNQEQGDLTVLKCQRYADALVNLIDQDVSFGGAVTLVSIERIQFSQGREGDRDYAMFLTKLVFRN
jgi:hypothetical protein